MLGLLLSLGAALVILWLVKKLHLAYASPLAAVPNAHFLAPFSNCWLLWAMYRDQESLQRLKAHRRHGPFIRLGPDEVGIDCIDNGVKTVYGGNFDRPPEPERLYNYGSVAKSDEDLNWSALD